MNNELVNSEALLLVEIQGEVPLGLRSHFHQLINIETCLMYVSVFKTLLN